MSKTILAAATAATIALTALGVTAGGASAAVAPVKKPIHHALVCKAGYAPHKIKVHGKWRVACLKVHHKKM